MCAVETVRSDTLQFWGANKDQFVGATLQAGERDIQSIDSHDALSIMDDPRKWFVYTMTRKVQSNSTAINQVLSALRARLHLLSQQDIECPFCLETVSKVRYHYFIVLLNLSKN